MNLLAAPASGWRSSNVLIAIGSCVGLVLHLLLRFVWTPPGGWLGQPWALWPLFILLVLGGLPLLWTIGIRLLQRELSADLLAAIAIVTGVWLQEYLAASLVVLMLAGGQALEAYAVRSASFALQALASRLPALAHCRRDGEWLDLPLAELLVGDELRVLPHEACPVDGVVLEGRSSMDESYLTGEPYKLPKAPGSTVLSGAINGDGALIVRAEQRAVDSRYAKIMQVMRNAEQRRPKLRRLGDQLGALYTPLALLIAGLAWGISGDAVRFLAVLVVATPCPLLIGIPVSIISSVSLAARRGIIIKDPAVLELIDTCQVAIFDKTGTLTCGEPSLSEVLPAPGFTEAQVLQALASLERYSRHPLATAALQAAEAQGLPLLEVNAVSERPGEGLSGEIAGQQVQVTSRKKLLMQLPAISDQLPAMAGGLECVVLLAGAYAGVCRFRDEPRPEGPSFIRHLKPLHGFQRVLLVSGDRESEVRYLADKVGIQEIYASQSPEQKLALVRAETQRANTVFMGDGINDAPALTAATVGIAFGQASDVTAEAAGAVILDSSLQQVDELLHIGRRMRRIALQSAVGGMLLSVLGMLLAAAGYLPPVAGALAQEAIDVLAVLNALRAALPPKDLSDC